MIRAAILAKRALPYLLSLLCVTLGLCVADPFGAGAPQGQFSSVGPAAIGPYSISSPWQQSRGFLAGLALSLIATTALATYYWRRQRSYRLPLQASERRYRALAERYAALLVALPGQIFRMSADGTYLDCSSSSSPTSVEPGEFLNKNVKQTLPPEVAELSLQAIQRAIETNEPQMIEYELTGEERGGQFEARIMRSGENEVVTIVRDIGRQRAAAEHLRQAQKMEALGQLSGGLAHEFNNLLTVIQANADLIARDLRPELEDLQSEIAQLQRAAQRGATLLRKLMAFSRHQMLSRRIVDLPRLVQKFLTNLRRLLPENIDLEISADKHVAKILADPAAIEQILINLATNARDAMSAGGNLRIEIYNGNLTEEHRAERGWGEPGDYVVLAVSDNGTGIDEGKVGKIFDPFFTTKPPGAGAGLGLPMIYGLVKQHRGYVDVESEVGAGTTVKLYFPAHDALGPVDRVTSTPECATGKQTILLVEDEEAVRKTARRVLERNGYEVLLAADGLEALSILRQRSSEISLVISDVVMPKMSGIDLYEAVKKETIGMPFMFMSGYAAKDVPVESGPDPSVPFLHKPWTVNELLGRIRELLDRSSLG
ncbi:MAG: response regulator [Gemmatimonadota bacterium]|nr:MAG: response regulator [Gemmatimonadota bacterium]